MNPTDRVAELLLRCGQPDAILPPTELFNEGWMLRLVLDWAARHPTTIEALRFEPNSKWYSEALLGSRFKPRRRGDTSGEGFTHADAVIGHFRLRAGGRGDIELLPGASQLVVVEAKMASGLSGGTKRAPDFNQAARNVACIAHLVGGVADVASVSNCGFVVLAPGARISEGVFSVMDKAEIARVVRSRADSFDAGAIEWCDHAFLPVLAHCKVTLLSWETVLDEIAVAEPVAGDALHEFYSQCLHYNPLLPARAAV